MNCVLCDSTFEDFFSLLIQMCSVSPAVLGLLVLDFPYRSICVREAARPSAELSTLTTLGQHTELLEFGTKETEDVVKVRYY